jgi:hypothetical protein
MLTIKGITDFCWDAVGVLLTSKDNIIVKKHGGTYWIYFKHTRGPAYLIRDMWERKAIGTKYEKVQLSVF